MYFGLMSMVFVAASVYQGLKTPIEELSKLKSTQPNILRTIMKSRIAKFASAIVIITGFGLFAFLFHWGLSGNGDIAVDSKIAKSPVEMMTAMSLERAFQRGGIEAVEKQCKEAFRSIGLRPGSLSLEQILAEFNGDGKNSERMRP
jgi:ABC-type amino acid transport system permease subunit